MSLSTYLDGRTLDNSNEKPKHSRVFKHQQQKVQATDMPVKSITMNICVSDNETRKTIVQ